MSNIIVGPEVGYVDLFLEELEENIKKQHEETDHKRTPLRPSSAGKCARELYFELMQYSGKATYKTPPMAGETDLLLNLGHAIERHLIDKLRRNFTVCEVRYTQQVLDFGTLEAVNDARLSQHLEGSMDLCFWSPEWRCVVDVKSKGDNYNFKSRQMKWEDDNDKLDNMKSVQKLSDRAYYVENLDAYLAELNDPFFESNFKQLNMYLNSEFLKQRGVDHGAIIQYHKAKSKLREIRFKPSQTVFDGVVQKFQGVINAVDTGNIDLAPAEYKEGSFKSRYCNFCQARTPGSCAMVNRKEKK